MSYLSVSGASLANTDAFLFRNCVFREVGLFNESYSHHEDGDLWMRVGERCQGTFSNHYGAVYRLGHGAGQLTDVWNAGRNEQCLKLVVMSALVRCQAAERPDTYRLFRLRLMRASIGRSCWRALVGVALRHPLRTVATALSFRRMRRRPPPLNGWIASNVR